MYSVYAVYENADKTEGRGPMLLVGLFETEIDAAKAAKGRGTGYVNDEDGQVKQLVAYESYAEFSQMKNGELKQRTLAKLTYAEQKALGLV